MALRHLEHIADIQWSGFRAALLPLQEARRALVALWAARLRLLTWAGCGLLVFLVGAGLQAVLVHSLGMSHVTSYIVQTVLSVQLSFALSRFVTWRDRNVPLRPALARFNAHQLAAAGAGMVLYAGLDRFGMNYFAANVAVTALLVPVSYIAGDRWSMAERATSRLNIATLPWPLFAVLVVQVLLSLRLIWSNNVYTDEALYLYSGGQELSYWLHGSPHGLGYQTYFSGAPVVYPPLGAIVNSVGGLVAARLLSLVFLLGSTSLLYVATSRVFGKPTAMLGTALFGALAVTQFLSALATYDAMGMFLLVLAAYLVIGRPSTNVGPGSIVLAAAVLALANACKYSTALWDPVIIGLALTAPLTAGYSWRYGLGRALRFTVTLAAFIGIGLSFGGSTYVRGILFTTVNRSPRQVDMGQPASLVLHDAWAWVGVVVVLALAGAVLLFRDKRGLPAAMGLVLLFAVIAAPANQARIGTVISLHKHVDFGAWFGCMLAGYALSRALRHRMVIAIGTAAITVGLSLAYTAQATGLYQAWHHSNPAFATALRPLLRPGQEQYLVEGYSAVTAYYMGASIQANQWKESAAYSYTDPQTGVTYVNGPAFADAIRHRAFTLVLLNFLQKNDKLISADIGRYGGYRILRHLPPGSLGSTSEYTVWQVTGPR
jgi:putative flippase GtrA